MPATINPTSISLSGEGCIRLEFPLPDQYLQ
jgi:hypothetical protein